MNDGKPLVIKRKEEKVFNGQKVIQFNNKNIFPEYYLIRVEKYQNIIRKRIDEWIYLIKNNEVKEGSIAKNIDSAAQKLDFLNMTEEERKRYEQFLINLHREKDILDTAKEEGLKEGREEGLEQGLEQGRKEKALEAACKLKRLGTLSNQAIADIVELTVKEIENLEC